IDSVKAVTCADTASGSINITVSGGTPPWTYFWTPTGDITQDINNLTLGTYDVEVTDNANCVAFESFDISDMTVPGMQICLVTVNDSSGKNLIVWDKIPDIGIASYNIYKEGAQSNVYFLAGNVPYNSLSIFYDPSADPAIRSWRYKISALDSCGNESVLSDLHKTMHLTMNLGIGGEVNLIWDHYIGFSYSTYIIYRGDSAANMLPFDTIPSNLFTPGGIARTAFLNPQNSIFYSHFFKDLH
ncbi:MAG: SprB repeat-containing protein, partial [Bacteroidetes bacterium]|nr:SprB repeat-containing protein [Bacteroidota bacterium]